MVSNKLSSRRQTARSPALCISVKPVPTIPPILWPPATFPLDLNARWRDAYGYHVFHRTLDFWTVIPVTEWQATFSAPGEVCNGWWYLDPPTSTGHLAFLIWHMGGACLLENTNVPVAWGAPSAYVVATWTTRIPPFAYAVAKFTF